MSLFVCVCVREREREREGEREKERERVSCERCDSRDVLLLVVLCACMCKSVCVRGREGRERYALPDLSLLAALCVKRERERESTL